MTFREKTHDILRTCRLMHTMEPGLTLCMILYGFFTALRDFLGIWLSGVIVDLIVGGADFSRSIRVIAAAILAEAVLIIVSAALQKRTTTQGEIGYWGKIHFSEGEKAAEMDYAALESPDFRRMQQIRNNLRFSGGNWVGNTLFRFPHIAKGFFSVLFSLVLLIPLLTAYQPASGFRGFICSPLSSLIVVLCMIADIIGSSADSRASFSIFRKECERTAETLRKSSYYCNHIVGDYHTGKDIRLFGMDDVIEQKFTRTAEIENESWQFINRRSMPYALCSTALHTLLTVATFFFVGLRATYGLVSIGSLIRCTQCVSRFTNAAGDLMNNISRRYVGAEGYKLYFDYMEMPSSMYKGTLPVEKRDDRDYTVEFRDVSFKYPASENWALRHVSLTFKIGERLALVGQNGSGKTTFIKLMCRLYDPTEGQILLNGIDIRKYDYKEYMSIFSVVFQDFKLFAFPLGENVAMGADYDRERAINCLENAGFGDRLQTLENGLDTCLYRNFDENGIEISGGEAQKIALARALYRDAPFIILDEPTAALDPIAEAEVYARFNAIAGDKTAIYISHRLSSCRFCDAIAVFDHGEIVQRGTHETLLAAASGRYALLWQAQAQYYVEQNT